MGLKIFFSFIFFLIVVFLLMFYWVVPIGTREYTSPLEDENLNVENDTLQFYKNMRYPDSEITYKISDCTLQKKDDMERAFDIIEENTILTFVPAQKNEKITVTCDSRSKIEEGMFIAGEGGPTNITVAGNYNVIFHGSILLIRKSSCTNPNIALHELLHALGYDHSINPKNIMFSISDCDQTIGDEILDSINELYLDPSYPDLLFKEVAASMQGSYLNVNISVRNEGLMHAPESRIKIYADEKLVKDIDLQPIGVGYGRGVVLENIWIKQRGVEELKLVIDAPYSELDKNNNHITLKLKEE